MSRARLPREPGLLRPALGTVLFFVLAPGTVAGLIPWLLTRWRLGPPPLGLEPLRALGAAMIAGGLAVLLASFVRYVHHHGTPAPIYPTATLVVTGANAYVRNPMYLAIVAILSGQAVLLGRWALLAYALLVWAACHVFVLLYEEKKLARNHGLAYEAYRRAVSRWLPRVHPWRGVGRNP